MHAKLHVLREELDEAAVLLDRALELVDARGLNSFRSLPESFRAEIDLRHGHVDAAADAFEHAFALGCEIGDPCWESIATRGRGLVAVERGDVERGLELLVEAPRLCRRLPDTYLWIEAYGLDALCGAAVEHGDASAKRWSESSRRSQRAAACATCSCGRPFTGRGSAIPAPSKSPARRRRRSTTPLSKS